MSYVSKNNYPEEYPEVLQKFLDGEKLTEKEIKEFMCRGKEVDERTFDKGRWTESTFTVIEMVDGKLYGIDWECGLTEYQENEFPYQPYEVYKHEYEKTITVTEWEKVK